MNAQERERNITHLKHSDVWEQIEAARNLARSGDPEAVSVVLKVLEMPDSYHSEVIDSVIDGLVEGAPDTLGSVLDHLKESPLSPGGQGCAMVLGEVAYRQGAGRDPRILPTLLNVLQTALSEGTRAASAIVAALRECARDGPVPEAEAGMVAVLSVARHESEPYLWTIDNTLEVLYANKGDQLLTDLYIELQTLPREHGLAVAIREFLANRSEAKSNYEP